MLLAFEDLEPELVCLYAGSQPASLEGLGDNIPGGLTVEVAFLHSVYDVVLVGV